MSRKSTLDPLTGVFNRYVLDHIKCEATDYVVVVDLDKFKELNDKHGHDFGDRVLIELVSVMQETINSGDSIIRFGGDEFILILQSEPQLIMDEVKTKFTQRLSEHDVSFTYGIEKYRNSITDTIKLADARMYRSKHVARERGKSVE